MAQWYRQGLAKAMNKEMDWDSDAWKLTLHTATYAPNLDTHAYVSDLTNELTTAGNYTAGGFALTMIAPAYTAANSWATTRANTTAYALGNIVRPASANGFLYQAVVAGTSAAAPPTYPTVVGREVTDGSVVWSNVGAGIIVLDANDVTQASFTAGPFRYGVISDRTPGTAATQPLLGLIDFASNQTGGGGTFTLTFDTQGVLQLLIP
jgi:hypothetical protein